MFGKTKSLLIFLTLLFILSIGVSALWSSYGENGDRGFMTEGDSIFLADNKSFSSSNSELSTIFSPIIGDLDNDGIEEIYSLNNSILRAHDGDYNLYDSLTDSDLNVTHRSGWYITDFIAGGNDELVILTTKADTSKALKVYSRNVSGFTEEMEIIGLATPVTGLACGDYDSNTDDIECIYGASDNKIYRLNESGVANDRIAVFDNECNNGKSMFYTMDFEEDGTDDFFFTETSNFNGFCANATKYAFNSGDNNYSRTVNFFPAYQDISGIQLLDLTGQVEHAVVLASGNGCSGTGAGANCCHEEGGPTSWLIVKNISDGTTICDHQFFYTGSDAREWISGGISCGASVTTCTPVITSINTCFDEDSGNCPNNEFHITLAGDDLSCTNFGTYNEIWRLGVDIDNGACNVKSYLPLGNLTTTCTSGGGPASQFGEGALFPKGVWADFDADTDLEFAYNDIFEKDGTWIGKLDASTDTLTDCDDNYMVLGELTGDVSDEIVLKNFQEGNHNTRVLSFGDYGDIPIVQETNPDINCELPSLFCDDFNYNTALSNNDWRVKDFAGNVITTFTPSNNSLIYSGTDRRIALHEISFFDVDYVLDSTSLLTEDIYSPVFSSEFELRVNDDGNHTLEGCLEYNVKDQNFREGLELRFCQNASILTRESDGTYNEVCTGCISPNSTDDIKINSFYSQRPEFRFNSSATNDVIQIFVNGVQKDTGNISYIDSDTANSFFYEFKKDNSTNVQIDEYYVMKGTDRNIDTSRDHYSDLFLQPPEEQLLNTTADDDVYNTIISFYSTMGLRSQNSRFTFGMFMLIMIAFVLIQVVHLHPIAFWSVIVLVAIIEVFLKLLPTWVAIVFGLLGAGAFALGIGRSFQGGNPPA